MAQTISGKWAVRGTMRANIGQRITRRIEVFAEDRGEAREAALQAWEKDGYTKIILNSAVNIGYEKP